MVQGYKVGRCQAIDAVCIDRYFEASLYFQSSKLRITNINMLRNDRPKFYTTPCSIPFLYGTISAQ